MITSIQLGNKTHDILHHLHQVQAKSLLLTSWVSFSNWKEASRMNLVSKWHFSNRWLHFLCIQLVQMRSGNVYFQIRVIFRIEKRRVGWTWCQNDTFFELFASYFGPNGFQNGPFSRWSGFTNWKKDESNESDVKMTRFSTFLPSIRLETKSCRISYCKLMVKYDRT